MTVDDYLKKNIGKTGKVIDFYPPPLFLVNKSIMNIFNSDCNYGKTVQVKLDTFCVIVTNKYYI